jgi:hypothetical protein
MQTQPFLDDSSLLMALLNVRCSFIPVYAVLTPLLPLILHSFTRIFVHFSTYLSRHAVAAEA